GGRAGHRVAAAHRTRAGRTRLQGEPGECGDAARRRGQPHRRVRVATALHPDRAGRPARSVRAVRDRDRRHRRRHAPGEAGAGHGSKVNVENAVTRLAAAVNRIGAYEWPLRPTSTVRAALRELAGLYGIGTDVTDVDTLLEKLGPAAKLVEATVRNSAYPTMLDAGYKVNVIPGTAVAQVDGRYLPGTEDEFRATIDHLTGPDVDWEFVHREVALQAPVDSPTFAAMRAAIGEFAPEGHVVPYCMSGGTDAKQFSRLGITGYGFAPLKLPEGLDYQALFHGVD